MKQSTEQATDQIHTLFVSLVLCVRLQLPVYLPSSFTWIYSLILIQSTSVSCQYSCVSLQRRLLDLLFPGLIILSPSLQCNLGTFLLMHIFIIDIKTQDFTILRWMIKHYNYAFYVTNICILLYYLQYYLATQRKAVQLLSASFATILRHIIQILIFSIRKDFSLSSLPFQIYSSKSRLLRYYAYHKGQLLLS